MTKEEAAKKLVELFGKYRKCCDDPNGVYAEAIALIYKQEVNKCDEATGTR